MAKFGSVELTNAAARGLKLRPNAASSNTIEQRSPNTLAANMILTWLASLPASGTEALTIDNTGQIGRQSLGGGGTVTSVALSAPAPFAAVSGSPVNTSGTLALSFASQAANTFLASPNGAAGVPSMRSLLAADIPKTLDSTWITNFDTQVRTSRLDQFAVPTAPVNFNSQRLTGVADPSTAQDAATKAYVDSVAQGLNVKLSARASTTGNITLSAPGAAIDGVTLSAGNRVLVKNQTTPAENGIYTFATSASAMIRATDMDAATEFPSAFVFVEEGTINQDTGWVCTTNAPVTVGTTAIAFTQFSGAGSFVDGAGLIRTGNQLDVVGTLNRITVGTDAVDIASTYVGQASITTLGSITTGVWNGTAIAVANGGTGAATAAQARTNLAASGVHRQSFTNGSLTAGVLTVTHALGQQFVNVQVMDDTNKVIYPDEITLSSSTQFTVDLTSFGTLVGSWNLIAVG
jgi:hypothetical protein